MSEKSHYFEHEKLDVYQAALKFVILTDEIVENLPRGRAYLADQLQRASPSILLNISEGAGELSAIENPGLKARVCIGRGGDSNPSPPVFVKDPALKGGVSSLEDEKVRFYRMARRSATECAGILAVIQNLGLTRTELQQQGRDLLLRVVSMLSKMVQVNGNRSENANANVHGIPLTCG